jgi:glycosyltransferase involved in cell wall biosynthesis
VPESRLHLAVYSDAPEYGGAEQSLGNLLAELPADIRVTVVATSEAVVQSVAARRPEAATVLLPAVRGKRDLRAILRHFSALRRLRPHIFHASLWTPWSAQYGLLAALATPGVRVVAVEQLPLASQSRAQRLMKRLTSARLAAHVAVGERAARLTEQMAGLPPGSVRTIYNGVPALAPSAAPARRLDGPVIGSFGRLHEQKGYDVLIRALASVPDVRLVIVGEGPLRTELEQLAERLGVSGRVELVGWRDDARSWLDAFDVFVLPSRFEGFPLSIVEAMLASTPVIASDVGSVSEAVLHERTGLLVPPEDPDALSAAIAALIADEERRAELAHAARERALEEFTSAVMARRFSELYAEILTRH